MMSAGKALFPQALELLKALIQTPSFSGEEEGTAMLIQQYLADAGINTNRQHNNIWAVNQHYDPTKPTLLLNSHHDTVKPNQAYNRDPFEATEEQGKLYGLGSNDAGGCLVALIATFVHFYAQKDLTYNLVLAATAEEENSGDKGIRALLPILPKIDVAVVGEPTEMQLAISEKGLLVIDGYATGIAGHAAHEGTVNAIYEALEDIAWMKNYSFPKVSETLGKVKMSVTQIEAGTQHNVIPAACHFVIDIRSNDAYTNQEIFELLDQHTKSKLVARSFKHNPSSIAADHPLVLSGLAAGRKTYGSPTLSDQSALSCPSLKMGPGDSNRSHTADEFIYTNELAEGIALYKEIIGNLLIKKA